ncbi:hypothetical protein ACFQ0B_77350 [Nonomuraea thailandensis]
MIDPIRLPPGGKGQAHPAEGDRFPAAADVGASGKAAVAETFRSVAAAAVAATRLSDAVIM